MEGSQVMQGGRPKGQVSLAFVSGGLGGPVSGLWAREGRSVCGRRGTRWERTARASVRNHRSRTQVVRASTAAVDSVPGSSLVREEALKEPVIGPQKLMREMMPLAGEFWFGSAKGSAWLWTFAAIFLAFLKTAYAVMISFIQRQFWTALSTKDLVKFSMFLKIFCGAVVVGPIVLALYDWSRRMLALRWREVLTTKLLKDYMSKRNFYAIQNHPEIDNPDQRLTEDVRSMTETAVNLICAGAVCLFDLLIFSAILYRLYPPLFFALVANSIAGSVITMILGRRLVHLNRVQLTKEADLRYSLIRVRENAENIAFYGGEGKEGNNILDRFNGAVRNLFRILGLQRSVNMFQNWYAYVINIVPSFVVAPIYFKGAMELGVISQIYFSFNHVLGDLGIIVSEFVNIASFSATVRRVVQLGTEFRQTPTTAELQSSSDRIERETTTYESDPHVLRLKNLSVFTPKPSERELVRKLDLELERGGRLLVVGASGIGKSSLMRAIAGLWDRGSGTVSTPLDDECLFLPQAPYIVLGSLKDNVTYPRNAAEFTDEQVREALRRVNLSGTEKAVGGLHHDVFNLAGQLSLGEKQRLGFARVLLSKPKLAILDESSSGLDLDNESLVYSLLPSDLTVISVSNRPSLIKYHSTLLRLDHGMVWQLENMSASMIAAAQHF